jgi:hypothetical protein
LSERVIRWRIRIVIAAWRAFTRTLHKWLAAQAAGRIYLRGRLHHALWFRSLEWTPAKDGLGHPHLHVWFLGPFLPRDFIEDAWARALQSALRRSGEADLPLGEALVFDVREVTGGHGAALEVIKYMTKDLDSDGRRLSPSRYAPVYEALDGVRVTQACAGFMALAHSRALVCEACGTVGHTNVRHARPPATTAPSR